MLAVRVGIWCLVVLMVVLLTVNAVFMVASPRAWFRLPTWLRASGSLTAQKHATGWGAFEVRVLGTIWFALITWVLYDAYLR
jgi:hypothetical protein